MSGWQIKSHLLPHTSGSDTDLICKKHTTTNVDGDVMSSQYSQLHHSHLNNPPSSDITCSHI